MQHYRRNKLGLSCAKLLLMLTYQLRLLEKAIFAYFWLLHANWATFHLMHLTYFQKFLKYHLYYLEDLQMFKSRVCSWLAISSYFGHLPLRLPSMEVMCHLLKNFHNCFALYQSRPTIVKYQGLLISSYFQLCGSSSIKVVFNGGRLPSF